jgi:hypothetical protein
MRYELAQQFAEFDLPEDVRNAYKAGMPLVGSLNFTKMMMFANQVQLTNEDMEYFASMPPRRMEGESYEDMKARTRFTQKLHKYRAYLYDYSVLENQ